MGLTMALLTAVGFAAFDLSRRFLTDQYKPMPLLCLFTLGCLPLYGVLWWLRDGQPPHPDYWLPGLIGVGIQIVANLAFIQAITIAPFSVVIPLLSLTPACAAVFAIFLLGEHPSPTQWVGILIVVAASLYLNWHTPSEQGHQGLARLFKNKGFLLMTSVAILWSLSPSIDKICLRHASEEMHGLVQFGGVGIVLAGVLVVTGRGSELLAVRYKFKLLLVTVFLCGLTLWLQFFTLKYVFAAVLEGTKRAIGMILAILNGYWFFDEPLTRTKILSVAAMIIGTVLIF